MPTPVNPIGTRNAGRPGRPGRYPARVQLLAASGVLLLTLVEGVVRAWRREPYDVRAAATSVCPPAGAARTRHDQLTRSVLEHPERYSRHLRKTVDESE